MLYAITFMCLAATACEYSAEMQRYEGLYVYDLAGCRQMVEAMRREPGAYGITAPTTVECVGTDHVVPLGQRVK